MTQITFSLIRRVYPSLTAENLEELTTLNLVNLEIEAIDNLEIFAHIEELNLSGNQICDIDNLEFMQNLKVCEFRPSVDIDLCIPLHEC